MNILVTGASGFIGSCICTKISAQHNVIGVDCKSPSTVSDNFIFKQTDTSDLKEFGIICERYKPDVVIHCAGIAHQKLGAGDLETYMKVNSEGSENIAKVAINSNPKIVIIFLSSVSVYGEGKSFRPVREEDHCEPTSHYAQSKLAAERRLLSLYETGLIHKLIILRLAPVYDRQWSLNIDRRVFAPKKMFYLKFGSGSQKMSAVARANMVDFIAFILQQSEANRIVEIYNVCDIEDYEFKRIIQIFNSSGIMPKRTSISVPLSAVWVATRIAGCLLPKKKKWLHSCYDKLGSSLIYDNTKMLKTGFIPRHSLQSIFKSNNILET